LTASSACPIGFRLRLTTASSPPLPAESSSSSCGLPIRLRLLSTLPRGNAVIYGYRALAYPGKDLHLAGCAPSRTHCSPCAARTAVVGAAFFIPLFWRRKKGGRLPGRTPGYSPRQCIDRAFSVRQTWQCCLAFCGRDATAKTASRLCPFNWGQTRYTLSKSSLTPIESNQEKATPMMAVRYADCTRRRGFTSNATTTTTATVAARKWRSWCKPA
jgi:hypothetical protein